MAEPAVVVDRVLGKLLTEFGEDFVELWAVLWMIRYELCEGDYPKDVYERTDPAVVRGLAFEVISAALQQGVHTGFYADVGPGEYPPPAATGLPAEVIHRLADLWDRLGREPSMGELAGFSFRLLPRP